VRGKKWTGNYFDTGAEHSCDEEVALFIGYLTGILWCQTTIHLRRTRQRIVSEAADRPVATSSDTGRAITPSHHQGHHPTDSSCQQHFPKWRSPSPVLPHLSLWQVSAKCSCDTIRTGKVEPLQTLPVAAVLLLRYRRAMFHISPSVVTGNAQPVCSYMETSFNTPSYLPGGWVAHNSLKKLLVSAKIS